MKYRFLLLGRQPLRLVYVMRLWSLEYDGEDLSRVSSVLHDVHGPRIIRRHLLDGSRRLGLNVAALIHTLIRPLRQLVVALFQVAFEIQRLLLRAIIELLVANL